MVRLSVFCSPDHVRSPGSLKLRGAKRGPRQARRWLDGVEIRRASTCHPERAAVSAANEGSKSATPSAPPPPSRVIPDWRVLAGVHSRSFQIGVEFRDLPQFGAGFKRPFVFLRVLCSSILVFNDQYCFPALRRC
jgi:hypothetical protein